MHNATANTFHCFVVRTGMQFEGWYSLQWRAEPRAVLDRDGKPKRYGDRFAALRAATDALCAEINSPVRSEAITNEIGRVFTPPTSMIVRKGRKIQVVNKQRKVA